MEGYNMVDEISDNYNKSRKDTKTNAEDVGADNLGDEDVCNNYRIRVRTIGCTRLGTCGAAFPHAVLGPRSPGWALNSPTAQVLLAL